VIVSPIAGSYGATTYVYTSLGGGSGAPAMYGEVDFAALIGHNLPSSATVTLDGLTFSPITAISTWDTVGSTYDRVWRLSIQMPAGNQPRPKIGELWIGTLRTFLRGPDPGITVKEGDRAQIRVVSAQGRQEILTDQRIPAGEVSLKIRTFTDAAYLQYKEEVNRGTRFGADPILLVPVDELEGSARLIFGRVGQTVSYSHKEAGYREFTVEIQESPMSGA
jgi:hypothetical protein